jgi:hypothetical protein
MLRSASRSILLAAAFSPLAVIPATLPVVLLSEIAEPSVFGLRGALGVFLVTSGFGVIAAYVLMFLIGVPLAFGAVSVGQPRLSLALVAGAIVGAGLSALLQKGIEFRSVVMMMWYGLVVSATFVAVFRRVEMHANSRQVVGAA